MLVLLPKATSSHSHCITGGQRENENTALKIYKWKQRPQGLSHLLQGDRGVEPREKPKPADSPPQAMDVPMMIQEIKIQEIS